MTPKAPVSKLPNTGTTIFTVMSRLAEQHGAVNLSQGFPDFDPPDRLIELVSQQLKSGRNQYAPMAGVLALREAIAASIERRCDVSVNPESEITVTNGATEALFCAILALSGPGDEVVIFDPAYDSYAPAVILAGATPVHLPLELPDFRIDWQRLNEVLNDRTRLLVINSPHNPTGSVMPRSDLEQLAEVLAPFDCNVLSDEVYEHIVFDGARHTSLLEVPALAYRGLAISSFGKSYHATGWKTGYAIGPTALTDELRRVHQFCTFASITPIQHAIADYMVENPQHSLELPHFYCEKRDHFLAAMAGTPFDFKPATGTYFQLADYSEVSSLEDVEFARRLTVDYGVATIPISVFYQSPPSSRLVRFCFAKQLETLDEAARRLNGLVRIEQ